MGYSPLLVLSFPVCFRVDFRYGLGDPITKSRESTAPLEVMPSSMPTTCTMTDPLTSSILSLTSALIAPTVSENESDIWHECVMLKIRFTTYISRDVHNQRGKIKICTTATGERMVDHRAAEREK